MPDTQARRPGRRAALYGFAGLGLALALGGGALLDGAARAELETSREAAHGCAFGLSHEGPNDDCFVEPELSLARRWPATRTEAVELDERWGLVRAHLDLIMSGRVEGDAAARDRAAAELVELVGLVGLHSREGEGEGDGDVRSEWSEPVLHDRLAAAGALAQLLALAEDEVGQWPELVEHGVAAALHQGELDRITGLFRGSLPMQAHFVLDRRAGAWLCLCGEAERGVALLREARELSAPLGVEACTGAVEDAGETGRWAVARRVAAHGGASAWLDAHREAEARASILAQAVLREAPTEDQLAAWFSGGSEALLSPDAWALARGELAFLNPGRRAYDPASMVAGAGVLAARARAPRGDASGRAPASSLMAGAGALAVEAGLEWLTRGEPGPALEAAERGAAWLGPDTRAVAVAVAVAVHADPHHALVDAWLAQPPADVYGELELRARVGRGEWGRARARVRVLREAAVTPERGALYAKWSAALAVQGGEREPAPGAPDFRGWDELRLDPAQLEAWAEGEERRGARMELGVPVLDPARPDLDLVVIGAAAAGQDSVEVWLDAHYDAQLRASGLALVWARGAAARWRGDEVAGARWEQVLAAVRERVDGEDGWLLLALALDPPRPRTQGSSSGAESGSGAK